MLASFYEDKPNYKGFYIDIGAFHPFRFSNTQYFYEKGWTGINIDATPGSMRLFEKFRPRDLNIEFGISNKKGTAIFYSFKEPALNTFDKQLAVKRIKQGWLLKQKIKVKTSNINDILKKYLKKNQKIDFISIDIEGLENLVIESLDWEKFNPTYLLLEALSIVDKDIFQYSNNSLNKYLRNKDYLIVAKTRRTLIYKRDNDKESTS